MELYAFVNLFYQYEKGTISDTPIINKLAQTLIYET